MKYTFFVMIAAAAVLMAQQKLEDLGVYDFQTMLGGSTEDVNRLAKIVDDAVAAKPKSAFPKFMHGVVTFSRSGDAAKRGDLAAAGKLFQESIAEMEEAVRWEPDNIGVRAPRGATLITASRSMPQPMGKPLLEAGVADFEHVLMMQERDGSFATLSTHQARRVADWTGRWLREVRQGGQSARILRADLEGLAGNHLSSACTSVARRKAGVKVADIFCLCRLSCGQVGWAIIRIDLTHVPQ